MKLFKDPVYNYIPCNKTELRIIDSPWFQRLRHCYQNGPSRLVYPTLVGSRFEHSLGVMHLAEKMLQAVLDPSKYKNDSVLHNFFIQAQNDLNDFYGIPSKFGTLEEIEKQKYLITQQLIRWIRLAGLCHDLGHFPLSHSLETVFEDCFWREAFPSPNPKRACHEVISAEFVRQIAFRFQEDKIFQANDDKPIITKTDAHAIIILLLLPKHVYIGEKERTLDKTIFGTLHKIIVGDYDADRLDYLQRDAHMASANFGLIDIERFMDSLRLIEDTTEDHKIYSIIPMTKAISALENLLLERYKEKKWIHFHHKVVFYDRMVKDIARLAFEEVDTIHDEFFQIYNLPEDLHTLEEKEKRSKYRMRIVEQLSGNSDDGIDPLSVYNLLNDGNYHILDCLKFVTNETSHFIDDIWFSQRCRCIKKPHTILNKTLIGRKETGVSIWKTPDIFKIFWEKKLVTAIDNKRFWEILKENSETAFKNTTLKDQLKPVFRNENEEYSQFLGVSRSIHLNKIEEILKSKFKDAFGAVEVKVAYIRWKNLFFDKTPPRMIGNFGREPSPIDRYSGLINSLIGLREEILFYVYLVGEEVTILPIKELLKDFNVLDEVLNLIADGFSEAIIDKLGDYCKIDANLKLARDTLGIEPQ